MRNKPLILTPLSTSALTTVSRGGAWTEWPVKTAVGVAGAVVIIVDDLAFQFFS